MSAHDLETLEGMKAAVRAAFRASGVTPRQAQLDYALHVTRTLYAARTAPARPAQGARPALIGGQALIEAETGVGKTLGYLIPLFLEAVRLQGEGRVLVSTYTVALQRQIVRSGGDLEIALRGVSAVTGHSPSFALRIGMRHFIDPERLADHLASLPPSEALDNLRAWAAWTTTGQLAEYTEAGATLPEGFEGDAACVTGASSDAGSAFYVAQVARAHAADVVVTNHATVLYDTMLRGTLLGNDPPIAAAVFDECDRLPMAAESVTCGRAALRPVQRLIDEAAAAVAKLKHTPADEVRKPLDVALSRMFKTIEKLSLIAEKADAAGVGDDEAVLLMDDDAVPDTLRRTLAFDCAGLATAARPWTKLAAKLAGKGGAPRVLEELVTRVGEIERFGKNLLETESTSLKGSGRLTAVGWSPRMAYPSLHWLNLFPAWILGRRWAEHDTAPATLYAAVFTSATIAVYNSKETATFVDTELALGLARDNPCRGMFQQFAPEAFGSASFVYADPLAPAVMLRRDDDGDEDGDGDDTPGVAINPAWVDYAAGMLIEAQRRGGRTLVIPSSFRLADALAAAVIERGARNVIVKVCGMSARDYDHDVLAHDDSIFIAAGAWEGYELRVGTANAYRNIFIPKVPFAPPRAVRERAIARRMARQGHSQLRIRRASHVRLVSEAQRRLRQGFGRGIRHPDDAMVLWIADPKYPTPLSITSGLAVGGHRHSALCYAIPKRFRDGVESSPAFDDAECFRYVPAMPKKRGVPIRKMA